MNLTEKEQLFLEKRTRMTKLWLIIGTVLMLLIIAVMVHLFMSSPFLINPFYVFRGITSESIPASTLTLMAAILPIVTVILFVSVIIMIALGFVIFSNEKQYQNIIKRLLTEETEEDLTDE